MGTEKFKWFSYKFIKAIKRGEVDRICQAGNAETNPLGESLISIRQHRVDTAEAERQRSWTMERLAKFSVI